MKTKFLKIARTIFSTILIVHLLGIAIMIMMPKEDVINVAKKGYYPPFVGSYIKKMENDIISYKQSPTNTTLSIESELSKGDVSSAMIVNTIVMTIIFFFVWLALVDKLDRLHTDKLLKKH